jgi:hypothetical protein
VVRWKGGAALFGKWRGKINVMPEVTGFARAKVEAENYPIWPPLTFRVYRDSALLYERVVTDREPFPLPALQGRDFELEVEGVSSEVFHIAVAQSATELAGG